jgi:hypothetical protein
VGLFDKLKRLFGYDRTPREVPLVVPPEAIPIKAPRPRGLHGRDQSTPAQGTGHGGIPPTAIPVEEPPTAQVATPQSYFSDESVWTYFVGSSNLYAYAYLPDHETPGIGFLGMRFQKNGTMTSEYWYSHVPAAKIEAMLGSASRGSYFYHNIRLQYPYARK